MKYFSTFTGVFGFDMGLPDDWQCVGVSEIDKNACKVIKYRTPDVKNYGDIEKIRIEELPNFDILVGGSPCQGLSMAGKRKGLDDSRSRLFFSYIEILKVKKPLYFIFENVKGLLSSNAGWDFATVISEFTEAGYDIWWQVLDATQFGIPQHRERVFILGTLRENGFRKVFFEPKHNKKDNGISRQTANTIRSPYKRSQATGSYIASKTLTGSYHSKETERGNLIVESKLSEKIKNFHFDRSQQNRVYGTDGVAPTLTRKTGGQQVTKIVASRGRMVDGKWVQQLEERTDATNTLTTVQKDNMVAIPVRDVNYEGEHAQGRRFKTDGEPVFTNRVASRNGLYDGMKIRYLTPLECERLMGWPDSWTKYGTDEGGNTVELSDNARYNLIGNGVVPQVVPSLISQIMVI